MDRSLLKMCVSDKTVSSTFSHIKLAVTLIILQVQVTVSYKDTLGRVLLNKFVQIT